MRRLTSVLALAAFVVAGINLALVASGRATEGNITTGSGLLLLTFAIVVGSLGDPGRVRRRTSLLLATGGLVAIVVGVFGPGRVP